MGYDVDKDVEKRFPAVWRKVLTNAQARVTAQEKPIGILLGGQPGAGKSHGTKVIRKRLNGNVIVINGDEFRPYKQGYKELYEQHGKNLANHTGDFSNRMIQKVRDEAIKNRFNFIIEGTFRDVKVPLSELDRFKEHGYKAEVVICTCPKEVSWQSTIMRGDEDLKKGHIPRYVSKESHDIIVNNLAKNVKTVFESGKLSSLEVYSREAKLFDSRVNSPKEIENVVNNELQGLNQLKKEYQVDFSFNKEQSEKLGQKSYDVLVNGVRADNLLKKDSHLSKALEGLATHKDMQQKGITAEALKSGTIQPLMLNNEFKVNRPEARTINATGSKIEPKTQELQAQKAKSFSL
ncbi:zeta toxin family protein [Haemophilus influenzae]|uniref:zeta toxin family protein n=1 Tax=Haemophilus influenzae TaxID=727 RepID=UPI003DA2C14A